VHGVGQRKSLAMSEPAPFQVTISEADIADLRSRLSSTRWPNGQVEGGEWTRGSELQFVQTACEYWRDGSFDFKQCEAALNRFPQFTLLVPDSGSENASSTTSVHFIHAVSPHPGAKPLLLTHGWPGSVFEFHKIIPMLTEPEKFGGSADQAFHVVAPSIPGYGFSSAPTRRGFGLIDTVHTFAKLMARLGYSSFVAQGGDWGSLVTHGMGVLYPELCTAIHLNMLVGVGGTPDPSKWTETEKADVQATQAFVQHETAYQALQASKPQTLSFGLSDSPSGLAAWILEKFRTWSDCDGDLLSVFTIDELLTNITVYWLNNNIGSSVNYYLENGRGPNSTNAENALLVARYATVPTGCIRFPKEIYRFPRSMMEGNNNVVHWTIENAGGHFAAMEQPKALAVDMRRFFFEVAPRHKRRTSKM
jgi:microsomal epoxide hydrolase